ncbi:long-chain-fatty-acid--[acyl-carrier-protein] ligase AEE15, chloroplastic-like [Curcuma longa]|uniref:long-chain-fatty-acid--[acyl-carrier-protein] ligase AEE15, chloroplastic-like n=1 Tax=Curcuma longa TaxID=136217 RepID=UPI003D9E9B2E
MIPRGTTDGARRFSTFLRRWIKELSPAATAGANRPQRSRRQRKEEVTSMLQFGGGCWLLLSALSRGRKRTDDLKHYQPQYLISVPLVYETLYSSIQKQITSASGARKVFALTLIKISLLYMDAKRIYEGKVLTNRLIREPLVISMLDWLWAGIIVALLWPLHKLGVKLLYSKIHRAIGISKAGISGGASLPLHIDRFFEAIGIKVQNGYGLTETSPVVAARRPSCNVI